MSDRVASRLLIVSGALGVATIAAVAAAIDIGGWTWPALAALFGPLRGRQPGLGYGAPCGGRRRTDVRLPRSCACAAGSRGDAFVASAIGAAVALVGLFTLYPMSRLLVRAFVDSDGHASLTALTARIASSQIWGYGGVVWNTLQLGVMTATAATLLALGFALVVTRTRLPGRRLVGVLAVVPMITPPFVIGLALIMLFGRSGVVNAMLEIGVRRQSDALDLRSARRLARANARAHAGCVSRARRCRRRDQPERSRRLRKRCAHRAIGRSQRSRCR